VKLHISIPVLLASSVFFPVPLFSKSVLQPPISEALLRSHVTMELAYKAIRMLGKLLAERPQPPNNRTFGQLLIGEIGNARRFEWFLEMLRRFRRRNG
jgi:hypothetical protein